MDVLMILRQNGIQPTPQLITVAECVLGSTSHPTADDIFTCVRRVSASRAAVYDTLKPL
jgi:Fe2+ or Zn2+ uptake regulation protein